MARLGLAHEAFEAGWTEGAGELVGRAVGEVPLDRFPAVILFMHGFAAHADRDELAPRLGRARAEVSCRPSPLTMGFDRRDDQERDGDGGDGLPEEACIDPGVDAIEGGELGSCDVQRARCREQGAGFPSIGPAGPSWSSGAIGAAFGGQPSP